MLLFVSPIVIRHLTFERHVFPKASNFLSYFSTTAQYLSQILCKGIQFYYNSKMYMYSRSVYEFREIIFKASIIVYYTYYTV